MPRFKVILLKKMTELQNAYVYVEAADETAAGAVADTFTERMGQNLFVSPEPYWESDGEMESDAEYSVQDILPADSPDDGDDELVDLNATDDEDDDDEDEDDDEYAA